MELTNNMEIIGKLTSVETDRGKHKLIFTMKKTIEIPLNAISVKKLQELQGQKISFLNVDGEFRVRIMSK